MQIVIKLFCLSDIVLIKQNYFSIEMQIKECSYLLNPLILHCHFLFPICYVIAFQYLFAIQRLLKWYLKFGSLFWVIYYWLWIYLRRQWNGLFLLVIICKLLIKLLICWQTSFWIVINFLFDAFWYLILALIVISFDFFEIVIFYSQNCILTKYFLSFKNKSKQLFHIYFIYNHV
jgi:hypothetical protein